MARSIPIQDVHDQLQRISGQIARLQIEKQTLENLLKMAPKSKKPALAQNEDNIFGGEPSPAPGVRITDAVRVFIRENPGRTIHEAVSALLDQIPTKAKNPTRSIYTTILNLVRRGDLRKEDGKLFTRDESAG
jgi:hypothetical protein